MSNIQPAMAISTHIPGKESLKLLLNWARLAQDRESWRNKIQDLLRHTPSTMLEMCN